MPDTKISALSAATTPLAGTEVTVLVQGGGDVKITMSALAAQLKLLNTTKVYRAILNQSSTNAPVATVLENTLGAIPVWSYDGIGVYSLTLAGAFPQLKTLQFITLVFSPPNGNVPFLRFTLNGAPNSFQIFCGDEVGNSDDVLTNTPVEILVFP